MSPQSAPNFFQFVDSRGIGSACEVGRVHRPDGGAHDEICADPGMHQLTQHADLHGSQAAAAREDESRPLGGMGHDRAFLYLRSGRPYYFGFPLFGTRPHSSFTPRRPF